MWVWVRQRHRLAAGMAATNTAAVVRTFAAGDIEGYTSAAVRTAPAVGTVAPLHTVATAHTRHTAAAARTAPAVHKAVVRTEAADNQIEPALRIRENGAQELAVISSSK